MNNGIRQLRHLPVFNQLWQSLEAIPRQETENSIWLRVLVQLLVVVGIVATDIAAETQISFWAVPLSIIGATWSWYRRYERNVSVKFLLAIGMLLAMGVFFANLLGQLNDTRLILAELLIQLQVLHSFDLPRRKDLGYSMVIGLILLGVAGTLSQTLAFAPLLLIFLAIALPVLILDYQSRLGISTTLKKQKSPRFTPSSSLFSLKRLSLFLLVIVGLGLTIFAIMPRFPGYQLQTFPVTATTNLANKTFDRSNRGIVNPGYNRRGKQGTGTGESENGSGAGGKMDDTFYYGFSSKINQNLRGELKPKVVMRVRSQAPGFWRVLAFDRYTGQGWEISREDDVLKITRPEWSYRFFVNQPYVTGKTQEVIQSYTVVSEMPNLIPALSYPKELYFPTLEVQLDPEGSLRSPANLNEGLTYSVVSEVHYRNRTLLQKASDDYPKGIKKTYLNIPVKIAAKVKKRTEELLATSPKPITSSYEKALFLAQALKQRYSIPKDPFSFPTLEENEDLVEAFLFKYKGGYPDHFSTTLTIMLRSIGIPARLVAGFGTGKFNPFTGFYVVQNTDAYAMTEVYFPKYGWFTFDPIPGHELIPPSFEEDQTFSVLQQFWSWVAGWLPSPLTSWFGNIWRLILGGLLGVIGWFWGLVSSGWVGLFTGFILAIVAGFLCWVAWNVWRSWRYRRLLRRLPPMESVYQQMLGILASKGYPKHPAQTPFEYVKTSREHHSPATVEVIEEISQAYVRWRYAQHTPNIQQLRQRLRDLIKSTQNKLRL
jgi:transglutaminase-like putative cysteine protease